MKDIIITGKHIRKELIVFALCLLISELLNIYAIIRYNGQWIEVVKSLGFVFIAAVVIYLLLGILRLIWCGVKGMINKLIK